MQVEFTNIAFGNGVSTIQQYYPLNNRLFSITTNSPIAGGLQNMAYGYDNKSNITSITDFIDPTRTQNFTYDSLNRVIGAQSAAYGTLSYQYNEIGNITYNSALGNYSYGAKPHAVTQAGTNNYGYDANGNMNIRQGSNIIYDFDNMPTSITGPGGTVQSVYDYTGQRVKKIAPSGATVYVNALYECTNNVCTKHIFAGGSRIASKTGASTLYYHGDHLGSNNIITDASGSKVEEVNYDPFGGIRTNTGSVNVKYKYTDQEADPETGLHYYSARYYDPLLGRFISADTMIPKPRDPQSLNRYSYARNNPLKYTDPTGHDWGDWGSGDGGSSGDISGGSTGGSSGGSWGGDGGTVTIGAGSSSEVPSYGLGAGIISLGDGGITAHIPYNGSGFTASQTDSVSTSPLDIMAPAGLLMGGSPGSGGGGTAVSADAATARLMATTIVNAIDGILSNKDVANFAAGMGNTISSGFGISRLWGWDKGLTGWINEQWVDKVWDGQSTVNASSGAYVGGEVAGYTWGALAVGLRGGAELSRFDAFRWLNQNPYFRLGPGRVPGVQGKVPTLRIGTGNQWWSHWQI